MVKIYELIITTLMMLLFINTKCIIGAAQSRVTKNSINRFADAAIRRIKENTIKRETEPLHVEGVGPYRKGQFSGLISIKRQGNASYNRANSTVTIPASLGQNSKLFFPCNIMVLGKNMCNTESVFQFRELDIELIFNSKLSTDGVPQLKICDIKDPFDQSVLQLGANGAENPILTWFGKWFYTFARYKLFVHLQDSLCNAIATNA